MAGAGALLLGALCRHAFVLGKVLVLAAPHVTHDGRAVFTVEVHYGMLGQAHIMTCLGHMQPTDS